MPLSVSSETFIRALWPKPSPAVLLLGSSRSLRGLPVLVHEASRRVWGLRLRRTGQELAISLTPISLPPYKKRQHPHCIFSELNTQPTCSPGLRLAVNLAVFSAKLGAERWLLLSRRTLSFPASCRLLREHSLDLRRELWGSEDLY